MEMVAERWDVIAESSSGSLTGLPKLQGTMHTQHVELSDVCSTGMQQKRPDGIFQTKLIPLTAQECARALPMAWDGNHAVTR